MPFKGFELSDMMKRAAVVAVLAAVTLIFFAQLLVPGMLVYQGDITSSDVTELNFPRRDLLSRSLKEGNIPTWTDLTGNGFPLFDEGQTGVLYPPNLVIFGLLDPVIAYNISVILSFVMGMAFTYMFVRSTGRTRPASLFSAVAFGMSGFFIARIRFMALVNAAVWLPLALYGIEKLYRKRSGGYAILSGAAIAMQLLAGWAQYFYYTSLLAAIYFIYRFRSEILGSVRKISSTGARKLGALVILLLLIFVVAAALSAAQILPTLRGIDVSNRSEGLSFERSTEFPMAPKHLLMFVLPFHYGNPAVGTYPMTGTQETASLFWENCAFSGIVTLVLALLAIFCLVTKERDVQFWLFVLVLSIVIALGSSTPVYRLLWRFIPGLNLFRFPQRVLLFSVLALSVLAGRSIDLLASRKKKIYRLAAPLGIAVLVAELALFASTQVNTIDARAYLTEPRSARYIKRDSGLFRVAQIGEDEYWLYSYRRAGGWHGGLQPFIENREMLTPESNMLFDVQGVGLASNFGVKRATDLLVAAGVYRLDGDDAMVPESIVRTLGMQNVRYVLSPYRIENRLMPVEVAITFESGQASVFIYRNLAELPRAQMVYEYRVMRCSEEEYRKLVYQAEYDLEDLVLLEQEPDLEVAQDGTGRALVTNYGPTEVVIRSESHGNGLLVLADSYYPGWKAFIDDEEVDIMRANYAFRAVPVPGGNHVIRFEFSSGPLVLGSVISMACLVLIVLFLFADLVVRRRRKAIRENLRLWPIET